MFRFFFKPHIHESFALAVEVAAGVTLIAAWIAQFLVFRVDSIRNAFIVSRALGPLSGLYLLSAALFSFIFLLMALWWRGRDVSHVRKHVFHFFLVAVVSFAVMTLPFVYGFEILGLRV